MGHSARFMGKQLANLYSDNVGFLNRPNNNNHTYRSRETFYNQHSENDSGLPIAGSVIYGHDGKPMFVSKKSGYDHVKNGEVTPDGKVNVEWTGDFQKNLGNVRKAMKVVDRLNPNGRITRSKTNYRELPPETFPASYLKTNRSQPEYAHAQPGITQNTKNPGPISKLLQKIGPKLGKNFQKLVFAGSLLGILTLFPGCTKNNPFSDPDPQDPNNQPQPSPTTAYVNINADELYGGEPITGAIAQLWQGGNMVVEGTFVDGYVQLKLTKNLTPNSSGQYYFGNYKTRVIGEGHVDFVSLSEPILVTAGGSTEMRVKMVNESQINVSDYRYLWRKQSGNWRYEGPSEIVVNLNQHDLAETGKKFNSTWMENFKKIFEEENKIQEITCGYITNITYNEDTNVGYGDPGTDGVFNLVYDSSTLVGGINVDYPRNGPSSEQTPVSRGICKFNPEEMPDSHSYQRIFHEFFDSLFRLNQNYVASVSDQKASTWSFGSLNGTELLEGYESLPGWVEVFNGSSIVTGYTLMILNPDYSEVDRYTFNPIGRGILRNKQETKYEFRRINPKEARRSENEGAKRGRIKN